MLFAGCDSRPFDMWKAAGFIMLTCPLNVDLLTPHLYMVKLGFTGYTFSYFCFKTKIVGTR